MSQDRNARIDQARGIVDLATKTLMQFEARKAELERTLGAQIAAAQQRGVDVNALCAQGGIDLTDLRAVAGAVSQQLGQGVAARESQLDTLLARLEQILPGQAPGGPNQPAAQGRPVQTPAFQSDTARPMGAF